MKTWDDLSDFEVNKAIFPFTKYFGKCKDIMQKKNPNRSAVMWGDGANWFEFDGCNSWADMGPIITDKAITINRDTCQVHVSSYFAEHIKVSVPPSKTLRAAAIVFLMMNGVNP